MIKHLTLLLLIGLALTNDNLNHINELKWKNRVLVIVNDRKYDFSKNIILFKKEIDERDFIIIYLKGENSLINEKKMSKSFSESILRKIKRINNNHSLFLIGKDGLVKKSYPFKINLEKIFSDVDKMPMRKFEIQMRKDKWFQLLE